MLRSRSLQTGFTLIEMIIVIVITGIVAGMVAMFIRVPVDAYLNTVRRAELTDEADTSLRFIARELKAALPNSIRCAAGTPNYIEFQPINSGGRYREHPKSDTTGTPLAFEVSTTTFDLIGKNATAADSMIKTARGSATAGNVVVGNLSKVSGNVCSAYAGDNASALTAINGVAGAVTMSAISIPNGCNLEAATVVNDPATPNNEENDRGAGRFFVVGSPVLYACGAGGLLRYTGYTMSTDPSVVSSPAGGIMATLAGHVSACQLACDNANARVQTISFLITVTNSGESVKLFRQVRVENLP